MNIAITTLVIFILLLPGLSFRRLYYTNEFSQEYFKDNFYSLFVAAFLPSAVFHTAAFYLVLAFGYEIDFSILGKVFSGKDALEEAFVSVQENAFKVVLYNVVLVVIGGFLGALSKQVVRKNKWDRTYRFFRFKNVWHYIFTGELFDIKENGAKLEYDTVEAIEVIYVEALQESKEGTVLYEGILADYQLSKNNSLDFLILTEARRRYVTSFKKIRPSVNDIRGQVFTLEYEKLINVSLIYYKLEKSITDDSDYSYTVKEVS